MGETTFLYGANIRANGIRQHYLRYGGTSGDRASRDPIIIVPGITSPAVTWGFVGERLGRHFDTYIIDVRGRGLSSAEPGMDYSLDAQARDLIAFAQALDLQRVSVLGHSMGARIGLRAARLGMPAMARLVAVDPPVSGPGRRPYPAKLEWYTESMKSARAGMDWTEMKQYCPTWSEEHLRLRAEWLHTCDETAVLASFEGFHKDDIHADLPHIRQPVLLMTAERGGVVEDADVEEFGRLLGSMQTVRVRDAGHMIPWDNEEGFYEALGSFLGAAV